LHVEGVWKDIYLDVKKAINFYYDRNDRWITVKKIRRALDIKPSNRSKINFIWRILQHFENEGYLVRSNERFPKQYKVVKFPIENSIIISHLQRGEQKNG